MSSTNGLEWLGFFGLVALACSIDERKVQVRGADGGPLDGQGADSTGPGDDSSLEETSEDGMGPGNPAQVGGGSDAPVPCVPDASQANVVQLAYGFALGTPPYRVARSDGLLRGSAAATLIPSQLVTQRRGTVDIAADGSFSFTPVDAAGFWGDDMVQVALPNGALSHLRLTVHPETLSLAGVEAGTGNGLTVYGESADDVAGGSVVYAGDVNGDGYDDVVVGAYNAGDGLGAAYVVFGTTNTAPVYSRSITAGQAGGFSIVGGSEIGLAGVDVSGAGDLNGDGLDDLMVSAFAPTLSGAGVAGAVYVVFGKLDSAPVLLPDIDAGGSSAGFAIRGEDAANSGAFAVAGAGDVNGDGWPDLIVGLYNAASTAGEAYVLLGSSAWSNVFLWDPLESTCRHASLSIL